MIDERNDIFNTSEYSDGNRKFRWFSDIIFKKYLAEIADFYSICRIKNILDIGCGTGQFAINLANALPNAVVTALDYSESQLHQLKEIAGTKEISNVIPVCSSLEKFQTKKKYDLIVCSEAIHLFDDIALFAKKVSELLARDGVICIRTPSPAQYAERQIYEFFIRVRYINLLRCKGPELLEAAFSLYGLHIKRTTEIDETRIVRTEDLIEAFRGKSFSSLHFIPQNEYDSGMKSLEESLKGKSTYEYNFKMTSYIIG